MKLTNAKVKNTKFSDKAVKLFDGGGLYLHVMKSGKYWRYKYRYGGKEKVMAFGSYPNVSLKEAREFHHAAKATLQRGSDPLVARRAKQAHEQLESISGFEVVAREFISKRSSWADSHRVKVVGRLEKDVFPAIGSLSLANINAPQILIILRKVEERGAVDTAHRLRQTIGQVFRYGVATGRCESDPTPSLRGALQTLEKNNYPVPALESVGGILRAIGGLDHVLLRIALQLASYTVPRSNEIIGSRWPEFDLKARTWKVPVSRMKHRQEHVVYLSDQVVELLETLYGLTGAQEFLFPGNRRNRPMVGATLVSGLRRAGVGQDEMVVHSFRGIFSTICNERLNANYDVIEKCLAHKDRDQVRAAYNRASYVEQRRELMQGYADYIDALRDCKAEEPTTPYYGDA